MQIRIGKRGKEGSDILVVYERRRNLPPVLVKGVQRATLREVAGSLINAPPREPR